MPHPSMAVRFSLLTQQGFAPTPLDRHVANTDLAEAPRALQWTTLSVLMLIALLYSSIVWAPFVVMHKNLPPLRRLSITLIKPSFVLGIMGLTLPF